MIHIKIRYLKLLGGYDIVIFERRNKEISHRKENENPDSGIYRGFLFRF